HGFPGERLVAYGLARCAGRAGQESGSSVRREKIPQAMGGGRRQNPLHLLLPGFEAALRNVKMLSRSPARRMRHILVGCLRCHGVLQRSPYCPKTRCWSVTAALEF